MKKNHVRPKMPPNPLPHVIDRLVEIGLTEAAGMGMAPISWQTIAAWSRLTGIVLMSWEARLLRHLSMAYLTEFNAAGEEGRPAPFRTKVSQRETEVEREGLRAILG